MRSYVVDEKKKIDTSMAAIIKLVSESGCYCDGDGECAGTCSPAICLRLVAERDALQEQLTKAEGAEQLCRIYFTIAEGLLGEDEVRSRRDAMIEELRRV